MNDDFLQLQTLGVDFVQANLLCAAIPLDELLATGYLNDPSFGKPAKPEMRVKSVHSFDQRWEPLSLAAGQSFYT